MSQEIFQQSELLERERDLTPVAVHAALRDVHLDIAHFQCFRQDIRRTPQKRFHAGGQFRKGERLHEVVIGSGAQEAHLLLGLVARGKDEDGSSDTPLPRTPAYLKAVHGRQHEVEDDKVVIASL